MKIGFFGGSFDPVHLGHLLVAQAAMEELGLDRLFFIPAAQSPFKPENQPAPASARLQLLRLALAGKTNCEVDDQEIRRGGVSYTIETLRDYAKRFPQGEIVLPHRRRQRGEAQRMARSRRTGEARGFCRDPAPGRRGGDFPPPFRGRMLKGFPLGVSSSEIRARVKAGLPVDHLVPPPVAEAIRDSRLYL